MKTRLLAFLLALALLLPACGVEPQTPTTQSTASPTNAATDPPTEAEKRDTTGAYLLDENGEPVKETLTSIGLGVL